ncbi:HNH endonuclease [Acinetobacter courvalinii]|jgi:hypothetical protein|uniref:HNH endonuclease signature motif containing protein n=1 Tax=Acinetobacter courvalinii TaxID=280147 RepID=UPI0021CD3DDF|nr:HNH endonuclease signature motif containing protein [Acinetobacter courvalinii]MCU4392179.1 HNH endonuclease [Acinetobacter courvalinii]
MNKKYENRRHNIPAAIRRSVEIESGHTCSIKGCFEHTYLEVHHIDNNRENNAIENLILLCDKHHKMAHTGVIDRKSLEEYKLLNINLGTNNFKMDNIKSSLNLHIVDMYELDNSEIWDKSTEIEIKLRNSSNEVIFLKEVIFTTKQHWETLTDRNHSLVEVSARYDVDISAGIGDKKKLKIHHEIKPQETDRIHFSLSTDYDSDPDGLSLFLLNIELIYNENSSKVEGKPIIINIRPKTQSRGSYFACYSPGTISKNKSVASEVIDLSLSGVIIEEYVIDALNSWLSAPSEEEYLNKIKDI